MAGGLTIKFPNVKFDANTMTTERSLLNAMQTSPTYMRHARIQLFKQYTIDVLLELASKFPKAREWEKTNNYMFRWQLEGMPLRTVPLVNGPLGATTSPIANIGINGSTFDLYCAFDYFAKNNVIGFRNNQQAIVLESGVAVGNAVKYVCKLVTNNMNEVLDTAVIGEGKVVDYFADYRPEGSMGSKPKNTYPFWQTNALSISRETSQMTRSASHVVCIVEGGNGEKRWVFKQDLDTMDRLRYIRSNKTIYGKSTVDENGRCFLQDSQGQDIIVGNGILEQISKSNSRNYNVITEKLIQDTLLDLSMFEAKPEGNTYQVFGGQSACTEFTRTLKANLQSAGNFVATHQGTDYNITQNIKRYSFNARFLELHELPSFSNPMSAKATDINPLTQRSYESGRMVFLNLNTEGNSNISMVTRENMGQDFIIRDIDGMTSYGGTTNNKATTSFDGATREYLSEDGVVIYNPFTCADLRQVPLN